MKNRYAVRTILFMALLSICSPSIFSQMDSLNFTGVVFDRETLEPLKEAVYSRYQTSYSIRDNGKFQLKLGLGDTVVFSHLGYKDLVLIASDSLKLSDYLTGVYLSRQTYLLSELMVFPRYYSLETMVATSPDQTSKNQKAAERNMRISTYQGLQTPSTMDNEMNQKMTLAKHRMNVEYKTMVSPDRIAGINTVTIIPETKDYIKSLRQRDIYLDMGAITTDEEQNYLKSIFIAFQEEMERKERLKKMQ